MALYLAALKEIVSITRNYLFNGTYAYAIFGVYALVIAPYVHRFVAYGEKSLFVALFGFAILILEFYALNFKLKMVRIRAEEKRLEYKRITGIDIIPRPGALVIFGLFARLGLRLIVMLVCLSALGFDTVKMKTPAQWIMLGWLFIDVYGLIYIYMKTGIYREEADTRRELEKEEKENEEWDKANLPHASSPVYYLREILADLVLQVYSVMLFTALWTYINRSGINMVNESFSNGATAAGAAARLFPMLIILSMLCIIPIRVAYWIEDSMMAFTKKEKAAMWIIFFFVALLTCAPALIQYCTLYFIRSASVLNYLHSPYFNIWLMLFLFVLILMVQIVVAETETAKTKAA